MMKKVWKFELRKGIYSTVNVPEESEILHVACQKNKFGENVICFWALVNPDSRYVIRRFHVYGTGHEISTPGLQHRGSIVDGPFVWHVFEENE